jgi:anti-sigma regulatory factor (Ser/Thr protein kinase)
MQQALVPVTDNSQVAEARRTGASIAARLGFDATQAGELAIVISELATNLVKHARAGEMLFRPLASDSIGGIEVLALDRGPGFGDVGRALRDGYSTAGSPGNGLGAVRRLAAEFDLYSQPGQGSAVLIRTWSRAPVAHSQRLHIGGVSIAKPGEASCGDAWACVDTRNGATVVVADGLGHGPDAAQAANAAVEGLRAQPDSLPGELLQALHARLRSTRGAAVLAVAVDLASGQLDYAGVGNISGVLVHREGTRHLVSVNGIVGHQLRRLHPLVLPWRPGSVLVLHSDGVATHWNLDDYPGLAAHDPSLIAGVLYRDLKRGRDDAAVVVLKAERA